MLELRGLAAEIQRLARRPRAGEWGKLLVSVVGGVLGFCLPRLVLFERFSSDLFADGDLLRVLGAANSIFGALAAFLLARALSGISARPASRDVLRSLGAAVVGAVFGGAVAFFVDDALLYQWIPFASSESLRLPDLSTLVLASIAPVGGWATGAVVGVPIGQVAWWLSSRRPRPNVTIPGRKEWDAAAAGIGLEPHGFALRKTMAGTASGFGVEVEYADVGRVRLRVDSGARGVFLRKAGSGRESGVEPIPVGDERFDEIASIFESQLTTFSVLGAATRAKVVTAFALDGDWRVEDGAVVREIELPTVEPAALRDALAPALVLAEALSQASRLEVERRLQSLATDDSLESIRYRALQLLTARYQESPAAEAAITAAANDASARLRLAAASLRGDGAGLAAIADDSRAEAAVRVDALERAMKLLPEREMRLLGERALGVESSEELRFAAARAVAELRIAALAPNVRPLLAAEDPDVRAVAARVFAEGLDPDAAEAAANCLMTESNEDVAMNLARGLSAHGGASAVHALQVAEKRLRGAARSELERALASVRARVRDNGGEIGQVSIPEGWPESGSVSVAEDVRGNLTIAAKKETP